MNHVHFICPQCRDIFCAAKPEHAQIKDGGCPECGGVEGAHTKRNCSGAARSDAVPDTPDDKVRELLDELWEVYALAVSQLRADYGAQTSSMKWDVEIWRDRWEMIRDATAKTREWLAGPPLQAGDARDAASDAQPSAANCYTLPNGECVSERDCLHGPSRAASPAEPEKNTPQETK